MKKPPVWKRNRVLDLFDSLMGFEKSHQGMVGEKKLAELIDNEFELDTQT